MNIIVVSRFSVVKDKTGDGFLAPLQVLRDNYKLLLQIFDKVILMAPVSVKNADNYVDVKTLGIDVLGLPFTSLNPGHLLSKRKYIFDLLSKHLTSDTVIIDQESAAFSPIVLDFAIKYKVPYAMRMVADPYDFFSRKAYKGFGRQLFRYYFYFKTRYYCYNATVVFYVTKQYLQQRYPTKGNSFSMSGVILREDSFIAPNTIDKKGDLNLLWIGHYTQPAKGALLLLKALVMVRKKGYGFKLTLIGNGTYKRECIAFVLKHKLQGVVRFLPQMSHSPEFFKEFTAADLFVLPSFHEGLPRVLLEAMARSIPCVAFDTGGIKEILNEDGLVKKKNPEGLANKIVEVMADPLLRKRMAETNFVTAKKYEKNLLDEEFCKGLEELKEAAMKRKNNIRG
jgi:glycosyltransferase involved in cell wall biosynthesis